MFYVIIKFDIINNNNLKICLVLYYLRLWLVFNWVDYCFIHMFTFYIVDISLVHSFRFYVVQVYIVVAVFPLDSWCYSLILR